jgi:hypothetical protein
MNFGAFFVSFNPTVCSGTVIDRGTTSATSSRWSTQDVTRTPTWDVGYFVKVPQSSRPWFEARMQYPWYTIFYSPDYDRWISKVGHRSMYLAIGT